MNKKVKIKKMIILVVLIVTSTITTVIVSCKRDNLEQGRNAQLTENCDELENIDELSENVEKITDVFFITSVNEWGADLITSVSTRPYYIPSCLKNYDKYLSMLKEGNFNPTNPLNEEEIGELLLTFTVSKEELEHGIPILKIEYPTKGDRQLYMDHWSKNHYIPDNENSSERLINHMSYQQANNFFQQFVNLSCATYSGTHCIPFQYAYNGCYARAHYMKKIIEESGYLCQKVFVTRTGTIKLSSYTNANCCVEWVWHVAPLVLVDNGYSIQEIILDPSLFSGPVSKITWINQLKSNCAGNGIPSINFYTTNSSIYGINGSTDDNYLNTYYTMNLYSGCYGCTSCYGEKELV